VSDERLERELHAWFRSLPRPQEPESSREFLARLPSSYPRPSRTTQRWSGRALSALVALATLAVVAVMAGILSGLVGLPIVGTRPTASPAPPSPTASPPFSIGPQVEDYGLLDREHGWAISGERLYVTSDGGATWDARGPDPLPWPVLGWPYIGFSDADHAWAVSAESAGTATFHRSNDGGRTWQASALPGGEVTPAAVAFLDARRGYLLMVSRLGGPGVLLATSDGGATWRTVGSTPAGVLGPLVLLDAQNGLALGSSNPGAATGAAIDALFATHDSGRSWQRVSFPAPAGFGAVDWSRVDQLPAMASGSEWVLPVEFGNVAHQETDLLATEDGGRTWRITAALPAQNGGMPLAASADGRWLAFFALPEHASRDLLSTVDGGLTWTPVMTAPLPGDGAIVRMTFVDARVGWALVDASTPGASHTDVPGQLYATSDGGASWRLLKP
jgi:photosystem II stability/assembly factor-like uncharacterized protein